MCSTNAVGASGPLLDNFVRICYFVDDESFESEEFVEAVELHGVTLKSAYSNFFDINHCNAQCYACYYRKLLRKTAEEPVFKERDIVQSVLRKV